MKTVCFICFAGLCLYHSSQGQDLPKTEADLPYYEIPVYPDAYTCGNVAARIIDGLGFRYRWATEGLREEDLRFRPGTDARTSMETLTHIYELSEILVNSTDKVPNNMDAVTQSMTFVEIRRKTLLNFKSASDKLKTTGDQQMQNMKLAFKRKDKLSEFPFWNQLNGPIADALWHIGQVVSFRRSSGNPFDESVNVFTGTVKK